MHSTLAELLENLQSGMLWVSRDGVVRYANGDAGVRTGLAAGQRLYDPDMTRAVSAVVAARSPRAVTALGVPAQQGGAIPQLKCRVIPGLAADDAFVLIGKDPSTDHGAAFDNLMNVIQCDLRDPLAQAGKALEAAQVGCEGDEIQALLSPLGDLLLLLEKLVDLASVWGSSALLATDRIELWPLFQQVWAELDGLAQSRSIKVQFKSHAEAASLATIYGSEVWLRRVFMECLASALRSSRPGATLNIEHVQMGPRALIVFRDCGVFAPRSPGAVEMPSLGGKPPSAGLRAHDQIGLKLCQHIVSLHGGQLREEDDDGLRNFLIDLPTGAPHRSENTQIDVAQAQRYAQDLAALMAKSRARGATPKEPGAHVQG
jgi:hypothetical protein